jgi:uncharacterized membrane protein YhhN
MAPFWLVLALVIAFLDWIAVAKQWKRLEFFAKPGVMVALLIWLVQVGGLSSRMAWFAAGLLFSLAGDVFLMLPEEKFIAGLLSFLLAHLAYLAGFNASPPPINAASLVLALLVAAAASQLYGRISAGLAASGASKLKTPVLVYSTAISLMLAAALVTLVREDWVAGPALLVSLGALLFFLSDTFLAWNKFVSPLPYGKLRIITTYHLGQALIVTGAALHFLAL